MSESTLHMIGNAHIDPVWLWRWQEGFQEVIATFRSAVALMEEFPEFSFTASSAAYYEWVERADPRLFEAIRKRVEEGRWCIVGGWWVQPDCNIPSGESFVRQGLFGQRYFLSRFGRAAKVGYNVDSFGHHGMLPQILRKSGMHAYVFMRPMPNEKGLPGRVFTWESDDGSRVTAFRIPFEYCTWAYDLEKHVLRCAAEIKSPLRELMCFYGVGNHGGGPTRDNLRSIENLRNTEHPKSVAEMGAGAALPELLFSTPDRFFESIEDRSGSLPVVHDDLQHHASGCYSVHSGVKAWNRRAEQSLLDAETWSAIAREYGVEYPKEYERAWKNVLFNQFHDILAGTSLERAYDDARDSYGEAISIADRNAHYARNAIASRIHIEPEDNVRPFIVFNSLPWVSRDPVEIETGQVKDGSVLVDDRGDSVPYQIVQPHATAGGRSRFCFVPELPSVGYRFYRLLPPRTTSAAGTVKAGDGDERAPESGVNETGELHVTANSLENGRYRLELDPASGCVGRLYDKTVDFDVFRAQAAVPVIIEDSTDTWSHNVFQFAGRRTAMACRELVLTESGPVRGCLRAVFEHGKSTLVQEFRLYREQHGIDVRVHVDWREPHTMVKLVFPVNLVFTRQTYEIPYGHIEREHNGEEEPGQTWVDYSGIARDRGIRYGVSLMNDAKYSYSINHKDLELTVLRSAIYAHHDPLVPDPGTRYRYIDLAPQDFRYTILPHDEHWEGAGTVRRAAELNRPAVVVPESFHSGGGRGTPAAEARKAGARGGDTRDISSRGRSSDDALPGATSFLSIDSDHVSLGTFKEAEDGNGVIVRLHETSGIATETTVSLPTRGRTFTTPIGANELRSFFVPDDAARNVLEVDLIERPLQDAGHSRPDTEHSRPDPGRRAAGTQKGGAG